jgi:hypothetical protein
MKMWHASPSQDMTTEEPLPGQPAVIWRQTRIVRLRDGDAARGTERCENIALPLVCPSVSLRKRHRKELAVTVRYDMIWHIVLTEIGLTAGGSSALQYSLLFSRSQDNNAVLSEQCWTVMSRDRADWLKVTDVSKYTCASIFRAVLRTVSIIRCRQDYPKRRYVFANRHGVIHHTETAIFLTINP